MRFPSDMMLSNRCSSILPPDARAILILAASDCERVSDPDRRAEKLQQAIDEVKLKYPQFFRQEL